jgi:CheY-like chemotaxis protein
MSDSTKTLLCVDDEVTGLSVRQMTLESQGYRVLTARNGREALLQFAREKIDLVILDYFMPEMDGGIVAEKMKALKPAVPILMLSAYVNLPAETLAIVDKSATKGNPPETLFEVVADLLRQHQGVLAESRK